MPPPASSPSSDQFRTQTISLGGTGLAPPGVSATPTAGLSFAATGVGLNTAAAQTITVTNNGGLPLVIQNSAISGDFSIASTTCTSTLAVGANCTLQIAFVPTAAGPRTGVLTLTTNSPSSPQTLALTGTGVDFTLTANGSAAVTVANGSSAVFPLLLSSPAAVPGNATFTCTGAPVNSICTVSPTTAALGATTTISVTIQTGIAPVTAARRFNTLIVFAGLLPCCLFGLRRRLRAPFALLLLLAATGCGANRLIPAATGGGGGTISPGSVTPPGNYNIVVAASSAGLLRSVSLTLTVQ